MSPSPTVALFPYVTLRPYYRNPSYKCIILSISPEVPDEVNPQTPNTAVIHPDRIKARCLLTDDYDVEEVALKIYKQWRDILLKRKKGTVLTTDKVYRQDDWHVRWLLRGAGVNSVFIENEGVEFFDQFEFDARRDTTEKERLAALPNYVGSEGENDDGEDLSDWESVGPTDESFALASQNEGSDSTGAAYDKSEDLEDTVLVDHALRSSLNHTQGYIASKSPRKQQ